MLIHRNAFQLARICTEDPRYSLAGIRIESDGTAVATDGHRLVRLQNNPPCEEEFPRVEGLSEESPELEPFTLPADACKQIERAFPKARAIKALPILAYARVDAAQSNQNGEAVLAVTDLESPQVFRPHKIEGSYPRYENVYPKEDPTVTIGFSPRYMRELCDIIEKCADPEKRRAHSLTVKLSIYGPEKPMLLELEKECIGDAGPVDALLMPMILR